MWPTRAKRALTPSFQSTLTSLAKSGTVLLVQIEGGTNTVRLALLVSLYRSNLFTRIYMVGYSTQIKPKIDNGTNKKKPIDKRTLSRTLKTPYILSIKVLNQSVLYTADVSDCPL